ncbi:histidine triad nucleotide-binding protein [Desulfogranum japonicum]|uniref:histidine triad nucleotide-binding protein n=1 Tax=Desulfogranum japonicum TaxID=231447 RepID=UPI00040B2876|nr:histidine triad nucleotide-binding protein [Desulfogranum japonicum]
MPTDCLFCKIIAGDIPAEKLYEDEDVLAFRDIAPQAPVHFLVVPKKHISGPTDVAEEDEKVIGKLMRIGSKVAQQEGIEQFRIVFNNGEQAGQTVFHVHMHVLGGRSMQWPPG